MLLDGRELMPCIGHARHSARRDAAHARPVVPNVSLEDSSTSMAECHRAFCPNVYEFSGQFRALPEALPRGAPTFVPRFTSRLDPFSR
jgi:hypothetical protein